MPTSDFPPDDYYETLQISPNADPDTVHRVYRLLAQRFHPDNKESGDEGRFRAVSEAYAVLSEPTRRAKYDVAYHERRQDRWRLVASGTQAENDFELEQVVRLTLLEILYTRKRTEPGDTGLYVLDLESVLGRPREHLEFTVWFLVQKGLIKRTDDSRLVITADGVEYLEHNYRGNLQRRRLNAGNPSVTA
jgi:curved DNA-binding protein CbpA